MSKKWCSDETIREVTDKHGNKQKETIKRTWSIKSSVEPFWYTYADAIGWIYGLKSLTTVKVLYKLLEMPKSNMPSITLSAKTRKRICESLEITNPALSKSLKQLLDLNIIEGESGEYTINPEVFWRGDKDERERLLTARARISVEPIMESDEF